VLDFDALACTTRLDASVAIHVSECVALRQLREERSTHSSTMLNLRDVIRCQYTQEKKTTHAI